MFDGIRLSQDLWLQLQDRVALNALRSHLLQTYFQKHGLSDMQKVNPESLLYIQAEKLRSEAHRKFQTRIREPKEESYFVRHTLFPRVIKELYNETCCVCGLAARSDTGGSIVDAAHILPFAEFHNDNPRNGIAVCKNHHKGFDEGWFTLSNDYRVLVSPQLHNGVGYVTEGIQILLPDASVYHPAPDALKWHCSTVFKR